MPRGKKPKSSKFGDKQSILAQAGLSRTALARALVVEGWPADLAIGASGLSEATDKNALRVEENIDPELLLQTFVSPEALALACLRKKFGPVQLFEAMIDSIQSPDPKVKMRGVETFTRFLGDIAQFQGQVIDAHIQRTTSATGEVTTESLSLRKLVRNRRIEENKDAFRTDHADPAQSLEGLGTFLPRVAGVPDPAGSDLPDDEDDADLPLGS